MGRWTQYDEDEYRLPRGLTRIAYDSESRRYTFRDESGNVYQGNPGDEYGTIAPPSEDRRLFSDNDDHRFFDEPDEDTESSGLKLNTNSTMTFHDILSPNLISSPSSAGTTRTAFSFPESPSSSRSAQSPNSPNSKKQFAQGVRKTALPKLQRLVSSAMKRSATIVTGRSKSVPKMPTEEIKAGQESSEKPFSGQDALARLTAFNSPVTSSEERDTRR